MSDPSATADLSAALRTLLAEVPAVSSHHPVRDAAARAEELKEGKIAKALRLFVSMPPSTRILANPPLYRATVDCDGTEIQLEIRSFSIRGLIAEHEIVTGAVDPVTLIFVGLFGRRPSGGPVDERQLFGALLDRTFFEALDLEGSHQPDGDLVASVAAFVRRHPGLGPEVAIQHQAILAKAARGARGLERGLNDERPPDAMLVEMIRAHLANVVVGGLSVHLNRRLRGHPSATTEELAAHARQFVAAERQRGRGVFEVTYSLLLGRHASRVESTILERMGAIQTHHGSAGSNMVARYFATLHTGSVVDFFIAAHMALDCERHFGAIHDMTRFIHRVEALPPEAWDEEVRRGMLGGGLPTFGHPEIAAAGRGTELQQDPRPAIYLAPLFQAIDDGEVELAPPQHRRLALVQRIYQIAFVTGVLKPGREHDEPLRLTPNTDFGAWSVQEVLGVHELDRTFLTYVFRGFGWMMDAREQLAQPIIRPVIPPDPEIVPRDATDRTIPDIVGRFHRRLTGAEHAFVAQTVPAS